MTEPQRFVWLLLTLCVRAAYSRYPACVWTRPFGFPVLPDVYNRNKTSSLSIGAGSHTTSSFSISWAEQQCKAVITQSGPWTYHLYNKQSGAAAGFITPKCFPEQMEFVQLFQFLFFQTIHWMSKKKKLFPKHYPLLNEDYILKTQTTPAPASCALTSSKAKSLSVISTRFSVLMATKTCWTVGQLCTALSTVLFSSVVFPPRTPWFTVMTVLDWAADKHGQGEVKKLPQKKDLHVGRSQSAPCVGIIFFYHKENKQKVKKSF